ncbi:calcium/sodium antiporter [Serinibacter salmoneus]|uniref:Cation:H+ antiporter n=1 Tax=Serinibacter salmoneus TaxID=556530 RepID=A0A2A9D0A7_9MICO|nr:calcium/sodium antiporter [Serinibacter salmoneus]PFG19280.1 cation:H+ antiporter [Serinibacter salmoneus]
MILLEVGFVVLGLALLVAGGEGLVRGASSVAVRLGMSPLVVGLTIVSVATSSPELAVAVGAVLGGQPELAVGNVVGSNIANILLILGISALVLPLVARRRLVRIDVPVMVALSVLLLVLALDGDISGWDGALLLAVFVAHMVWAVRTGRGGSGAGPSENGEDDGDADSKPATMGRSALLIVVGVGLLVLGSQLLVRGASAIASAFGLSDLVIGLTVVAVGTSLPELAASIIAVRKGQRDLAVGNVVGSNIANIGLVLGLPSILSAGGIPVADAAIALDIPLMVAVSLALLPIAFTGFVIQRWEGAIFLALYLSYMTYLVLWAGDHAALRGFTAVMTGFVLPLIVLTLALSVAYEIGLRRGRKSLEGAPSDDG